MAYIKIESPSNYASAQNGERLDIKFRVVGNVSTKSSSLIPRVVYKNNAGASAYLTFYEMRAYNNKDDKYVETDFVNPNTYFDKYYTGYIIIPSEIQLGGSQMEFYLELNGTESFESSGELGLRSHSMYLSTKLEMTFATRPIKTGRIVSSVKLDLTRDSYTHPGDQIRCRVLATNNALDDSPVWEDITEYLLNGNFGRLSNSSVVREPAISVKVTLSKGNNKSYVRIKEINLAFI